MIETEIGIDIAKDSFDCGIELPGGKRLFAHFPVSKEFGEFENWLLANDAKCPHLYMEATGRYWEPLAFWAHSKGYLVTVLNPRYPRKFAESEGQYNKTDKQDANCILSYAKTKRGRLWSPPTPSFQELREISMALYGLEKQITASRNRLKSGISHKSVTGSLEQTIVLLKAQKADLERRATKVIKSDKTLKLQWQAIKQQKGIGEKTATKLISMIDFSKFQKGRQLVAFAGLAPKRFQSGKSVKKKDQISKIGHSKIRGAMYLPAIVASTHDPELKEMKVRMALEGKPRKVIFCAVMAKLLRTSFALVRDAMKESQMVS